MCNLSSRYNMKINITSKYNLTPSINNKKQTKQVTFGHYLDSEKSSKKERLADLDSAISRVNSHIWNDNYDFERESSSLNVAIENAENALETSEERVSKLKKRIASKENHISSLEYDSYELQNQAEENNKQIKQLEEKKQNTIKQVKKSNEELQKSLDVDWQATSNKLNSQYKATFEMIQNGAKNCLIQNIVNPILQATEGIKTNIPASIYIEDEAGISEPYFSWLVKQTDSNYAKLRILDSKQALVLLKKISILASRCYEENGKHTFTLLDGFENIINALMNNDTFKNLLTTSEKLYHNIIVVVSKIPYKEIINGNSFNTIIKVEKSFTTDKQVGRNSLVEFASKHPLNGENLLSKIIK